ncbi:MAG: ABC transporter ATP-binding protein [Pseudomonadota bacterium]
MAFVRLEGTALAYPTREGDVLALEHADLSIQAGEFTAVVGPSGCGKSTLMRLVTGLRPPTRGNVIVDGREVAGPLKFVGMAFQNATLLPWRTVIENLLLPLEIVQPHRSRLRRQKASYVAKAEALLATVGLDGFGNKFPWELSGGMQQRVSLCRALIHEPKLLMLDEPFAALDAFTREELWCVLRDLWEAQRFTVILVTHDLREAVFLADTVHVMSARPGRILYRHEIGFARPRDLEVCYSPEFVDTVHRLRGQIAEVRGR